jgi:hypothetical protein
MTGQAKSRFAVGLFGEPLGLWSTFRELGQAGMPPSRIHILGTEQAIERSVVGGAQFVPAPLDPRVVAAGLAQCIVCRPILGAYPWQFETFGNGPGGAKARGYQPSDMSYPVAPDLQRLVEPGSLEPQSLGAEALVTGFQHWGLVRPGLAVESHLRGDGPVLVVNVLSDLEQQGVCATMLRHASTSVQTHELRL